VLDGFEESSQSTSFCVFSTEGADTKVTEREMFVERQTMFRSVFSAIASCRLRLSPLACTGLLNRMYE
jgi:hypothetical protein